MSYIITKDIFGTWKKGKVITRRMVADYLIIGLLVAGRVLECWEMVGYIKPYKPKK